MFTTRGLELSYPFDGEPADIDRIPWRVLGPYLRADSVLAPILAAEGIGFAPVGTTLSMPASAPAIAPKYGSGGTHKHLLQLWLLAPEPLRALARLATPADTSPRSWCSARAAIRLRSPSSRRAGRPSSA